MRKLSTYIASAKNNLKLIAVAVVSLTVGGLSPALVRAAVPSTADGQISGCYRNNTGALRIIDAEAGATCSSTESPLSWPSQQGTGGGSGSQTAYTFLNLDGTLDTATSKNTNGINRIFLYTDTFGTPVDYYNYCIDLTFVPKWTINSNSFPPQVLVRGVPADAATIDTECGPQYDAFARDVRVSPVINPAYHFAFFD